MNPLPPLEIVPEVRGAPAIPTNFRVLAQWAVRPIAKLGTNHFQVIHNQYVGVPKQGHEEASTQSRQRQAE